MKNSRKTIRLNKDSYLSGTFFITICVQQRKHLFGNIVNSKVIQTDAGKMISRLYFELENKFPNIRCGEHITIPDHFHCLITKTSSDNSNMFEIIRWFKTMTTNEYIKGVKLFGWKKFHKQLWQRGYYDRIIRNTNELTSTRNYIINNPQRSSIIKQQHFCDVPKNQQTQPIDMHNTQ